MFVSAFEWVLTVTTMILMGFVVKFLWDDSSK